MSESWRPIETAPFRELVTIKLPGVSRTFRASRRGKSCWWQIDDGSVLRTIQPTHWQPLPHPPPERDDA